jgi:hypothetical protein
LDSADVNYQALAWEVKCLKDRATAEGRRLSILEAVRAVMLASIAKTSDALASEGKQDQADRLRRHPEQLLDAKIDTHYTEARKWLARWKKGEKAPG